MTHSGVLMSDNGGISNMKDEEAMKAIVKKASGLRFSTSSTPSSCPSFAGKTGPHDAPEIEAKEGKEAGKIEPFNILITQGMVQRRTFKDSVTGVSPKLLEVDLTDPSQPFQISTGLPPNVSWEKMSKFYGVDTADMIASYGADVRDCMRCIYKEPWSSERERDQQSMLGSRGT